jgi:peptidoglycan/xylan/chitin deacetylase (PgdA/CDA1 family)
MAFAPLFPVLYRLLQPVFPGCLWAGNPNVAAIALTFDDGPHPQYTPELLKVLDQYGILASFFWLGVCVNHSPKVARVVYDRGHGIGLHGYDHRVFPRYTPMALKQSLEQTQVAIAQACNLELEQVQTQVRNVRPPNGVFTPQTLQLLNQWGYRPTMWSVVPEDWVRPGQAIVIQRIMQQVQKGSLIVLHDGYCGGQDVAATAAELIPALLQQGYQFVTVDQLWQLR